MMAQRNFTTRPASAADEEFLRGLHKAAYHEIVVRQFGQWDDALQFSLFSKKWAPERFEVLELAGRPVGCISVEYHPDHVFLAEIQILPEYQGRGIGGELVRDTITHARRLGQPVRLQVLKDNDRARAFYERLGFQVYDTVGHHHLLSTETRTANNDGPHPGSL